jgi:hypothetical protein
MQESRANARSPLTWLTDAPTIPYKMLPAIAYTLAAATIAALLTCGYTLTRPIHKKDEFKSWRVMLLMFVVCFSGPYLYLEVMTRYHSKELDHAIKASIRELPLNGHMMYYKVRTFKDSKATVMVVGNEKLDWGGTDHPQYQLTLKKEGKEWKTVSYKVWNSARLNIEAYVFPVYW